MNYREGEACEDQQGPGIPHRNPTRVLPQVRLPPETFLIYFLLWAQIY